MIVIMHPSLIRAYNTVTNHIALLDISPDELVERLFDELVLVGVEVGGGFDHTMTSFEC
jgi:hypothetical protein